MTFRNLSLISCILLASTAAGAGPADFHDLLTLRELLESPPTPARARALKLPARLSTDLGRPYVLRETRDTSALIEINGHRYRIGYSDQAREPGAEAIQYPLGFLEQLQHDPTFASAKNGGYAQLVYAMALGNNSLTEARKLYAEIRAKARTPLSSRQQAELTAAAAIVGGSAEDTLALYRRFRAANPAVASAASTLVFAAAAGGKPMNDVLKLYEEMADAQPDVASVSDRAVLTTAAVLGNKPVYEVGRAYRDLHMDGAHMETSTCAVLAMAVIWGDKSTDRVLELFRQLHKAKPGLSNPLDYANLAVTAAVDDMIILRKSAEQASLGPVARSSSNRSGQ